MTVRHVIDCIQPHHQGVYTCTGQAREQIMASDPVAISVEGINHKYDLYAFIRDKFYMIISTNLLVIYEVLLFLCKCIH